MRQTPSLSPTSPRLAVESAPLVSILVPAKDEAKGIASCLEALLEQDYPHYEILVADDRSVDQTAQIVEEISRLNPRVRLVRITHLPEGWTGKTNALQQLQEHARGEWLLFVDADTRQLPVSLSVMLQDAIDHQSDMLSAMPSLDMKSFWECVVQPFAAMCLMILYPLPQVNDPRQKTWVLPMGSSILVRRTAYDAIGQHTLVRDKFVEDIHLGRLIRTRGLSLRVVMAPDLTSVRMYSSLTEINRGWSRILYSAVDGKSGRLWVLQSFILIFSVLSYVVLGITIPLLLFGHGSPFLWTMFGLGVAHEVLQVTMFAGFIDPREVASITSFWPLAVFVMLYVVGKAIRMCHTHVVTWRGTSYDAALQSQAK